MAAATARRLFVNDARLTRVTLRRRVCVAFCLHDTDRASLACARALRGTFKALPRGAAARDRND